MTVMAIYTVSFAFMDAIFLLEKFMWNRESHDLDRCFRFRVRRMLLHARIKSYTERAHRPDVQIVFDHFVPTRGLKLVQTLSAGVDRFKLSDLPGGVVFCSNAGAYSDPVAEHAFALLPAQEKDICGHVQNIRNGVYRHKPVGTLAHTTLGVLGYGGIGRSAARIAKAFGMNVIGHSRHNVNDQNMDEFTPDPEELFSKSDFVLISITLTKSTSGLVAKRLLDRFAGRAIINIARADIVNQWDMFQFLKDSPEIHYLTDVWWNEPHITFPIPENVILTPHVAGVTDETINSSRFMHACKNVKNFIEEHPENVVNVSEYL